MPLTKPGRLSEDEYELMKRHSSVGARIVSKFGRLRECVPILRHHHERWDGTGYPERLAGEDIPFLATIVGFADAWDAMTIERPYQRALRIEEGAGASRHAVLPIVVDAFFASGGQAPGRLRRSGFRSARRGLAAQGGRTSTVPAEMSAPTSPFRCSMRQIAFRGSPA